MKPVLPVSRKPDKMGFDNFYFIQGGCICCGVTMEKRCDELWKTLCSDCAPELYENQVEPSQEPQKILAAAFAGVAFVTKGGGAKEEFYV